MKQVALVLMSTMALAMSWPAGAQTYLYGMPSTDSGGISRGRYGGVDDGRANSYNGRNPGDWREHRNDWQDKANNWRANRNDWRDTEDWRPRYPLGEDEAKARAKVREYDDKKNVKTKDDEYSADCNAANPWRGGSSNATCR